MGISRTKKAALNTTLALLSEIVSLVCGLILPRLILRSYGSAYNGITTSAKQFLSAISILTLGIAGTTRVALYRSLASDDTEKTSGIVKATELYMRKVGFVMIAYVVVLTVVYPLFVDTGYSWIEVAPLIVAASLSALGRYFFGMAYRTLLIADQCLYITNIVAILSNIVNTIVNVILIYAGCSIQVVRMTAASVLLLNPILLNMYVKRKYKLIRNCKPDKSALSMRKDVMAHSIANMVHDNTDIIVLTLFTNVKIVSVYSVYNLVMNGLKKTQTVFTSGTEAIYGNMWAKKEYEKIRTSLESYEYIVTSLISTLFATAMVMILPFISLYTKGVNDVEYILPSYAIVITAAQAWFCMRAPYLTLVQGVGHYKQTRNGALIEAAMNLIISVVLVQFVGIIGVAIGTLVANVFRTLQYAIYIDDHLIKRGKNVFVRRMLWACLNVVITMLISKPLVKQFSGIGWTYWVLAGCITITISALITFASSLVFYKNDMYAAQKIIMRAIKRNKNKA